MVQRVVGSNPIAHPRIFHCFFPCLCYNPSLIYFMNELEQLAEIVRDPEINSVILEMHSRVLKCLEVPDNEIKNICETCLGMAALVGETIDIEEYEKSVHTLLGKTDVLTKIPEKLKSRAIPIYNQIAPYLKPGRVLDLGCGDGAVGALISSHQNMPVDLADVYKHNDIHEIGLPFTQLAQNESLPFDDNSFDNVLLLTVLHHSDDPELLLREARRILRPDGRLIVIESVFGVDGSRLPESERDKIAGYLALDPEKQRSVNAYFDHFYNRIIHYNEHPKFKVNVPFEFDTPENWELRLKKNGFKSKRLIHVGQDRDLVPEYHTLHVLDAYS